MIVVFCATPLIPLQQLQQIKMEQQLNNPPFPMRPPGLPPGMNPTAMNPTGMNLAGMNPMMQPPFNFPIRAPNQGFQNEQEEKKNEFKRGIFVSGFEKCVTTAMIQKHFSIKPINGLKHPQTKFKESKGFAFIYYGSEDDALYVKKTLDRTAILREKIRITRTVISQNLSKMMFKLKTQGLSEKEIQEKEAKYFNDQNLEKEVERIISPLFESTVEVNKISIPRSKSDKKLLRYARVFFYVSDVKKAKEIAELAIKGGNEDAIAYDTTGKNEYEIILNCISNRINNDDIFGGYAKSEIYEYTKKNQSNVLHLKGVKANPNEDASALADEIKEFMQKQGPQWNIVNAYAAIHEQRGAWANITLSTYEETIQAYEHLKALRPKFRDGILYGSLRNVKDPRTVVISVVRKEVTEKDVRSFLDELAAKSVKRETPGEDTVRKYDYFSFNIIESKKFFKIDGDETKGVTETDKDTIHPSWIEINEVPRRLIIHFFHEFNDEDIKELNNDITVTPNYDNIFIKGDRNRQLRSNHQKGHVNKDGVYIKHTEMKGKKKVKAPKTDKPMRRPNFNDNRGGMPRGNNPTRPNMDFSMGAPNRQPPKIPTTYNMPGQGFKPQQIGAGGLGNIPAPGLNRPPQGFNAPPSNLPPSMAPPSNLPPPGMTPPNNLPPGMGPYRQPYPQNPMGLPPQGNMPQGSLPPQPRMPGQYAPKPQGQPMLPPQGQRPPE